MILRVINARDERVLKGDAAIGFLGVIAAGFHQFGNGKGAIDGHNARAQRVFSGVQADSQVDLQVLLGKALDLRNQANGTDGEAARTHVETVGVIQGTNGRKSGIIVMERLAHAHDHDIGEVILIFAQMALEMQHLGNDLTGREVAFEAHLPGGTESTAHGTAGLGGDAERIARIVAHQHGFDALAIRQAEQGFLCQAIFGDHVP